jgi:site-specific DNA-methyltransferase (adenine-specific)
MREFLNMDCMEGMKCYPDNRFDLAIVDPPYGIDYQSARRTDKTKWHKKIVNDKVPFIEWIPILFKKMKDSGRLVCFYRWDVANIFQDKLREAGFILIYELIWDKVIHGMGDLKGSPAPQHENMIYCTKSRFEFNGKRPKSVYRIERVNSEKMIHPNEKPLLLYKKLTEDFTFGDEICIDPFAGSANSLRCWEALGFDYVGFEIDNDYYAAATKRIEDWRNLPLFDEKKKEPEQIGLAL